MQRAAQIPVVTMIRKAVTYLQSELCNSTAGPCWRVQSECTRAAVENECAGFQRRKQTLMIVPMRLQT